MSFVICMHGSSFEVKHFYWRELLGKYEWIKARNSYSFGDQFVHFKVSIPMNLTQRQRQLIEEFARDEQGEDDKDAAAGASS
nr:chaperone protein DnaJ GFA2, mitochondrial [Ipomoea batatas]